MNDYRDAILKDINRLEQLRKQTPIWKIFKLADINEDINSLYRLYKKDLDNE